MKYWAKQPFEYIAVLAIITLLSSGTDLLGQDQANLPRFASVRAGVVNMRTGPGRRYPIDWVLTKRNQPIEIVGEFDTWRQVRDWQGDVGWVHRTMLTSQRTVLLAEPAFLHRRPDSQTTQLAQLGVGVIADLLECEAGWCRIEVDGSQGRFKGWVAARTLWGVTHIGPINLAPEIAPELAEE